MRRNLFLPVLVAVTGAAFADAGDPPARVARLNYISGSVSFRPGNVEQWTEATLNYPMTIGDHLWADEGAGAEMHIGSTAIRLAGLTAVEFLNIDDRVAQLSVREGGLNVRLRRLEGDETFEIDTPNAAIVLLRAGVYRVDVNPDSNSTFVAVRAGEAEVNGAGNPFRIHAGQMAHLGGDPPNSEIGAVRPPDAWDQWCMDRDRREEEAIAVSARYVPREMVGAEDLGSYGVWREEAEYGIVWVPRVNVGWVPYRHGHWAWVEPWGWTWIDEAPWGFAPFHYGRWAFARGTWVWVPGAVVARPVYAPHLAVFVGSGVGVAWFPLGPHEVFVPSYRVSTTYVRQVNITHVTNITNITNVTNVTNVRYVNRNVNGAVTAVPQQVFAGARPVGRAAVAVSPQDVSRAQVMRSAPVSPSRDAMLGRPAVSRVSLPPARVQNREVVAKTAPPPAAAPRVRQIQPAAVGRPSGERPANLDRPARVERPAAQMDRPAQVQAPPQPDRPARVERPAPAARPAQVDRPAVVDRPARSERPAERPARVERPAAVERPPQVDRPAVVDRPARSERPAERPARVERPADTARPAPEVRREANPERRQERKAERDERRVEKKESRKEDK